MSVQMIFTHSAEAVGGGNVAIDVASSFSAYATDPLTWSHTVTGSNRVLLVGVSTVADTVTGVTYNDISMTLLDTTSQLSSQYVYHYGLIAPDTGTHDIVVSCPGNAGYKIGGAISFTGAHQTTPWSTSAKATGNNTTATVDISSASTEIVMDTAVWWSNVNGTVGTNQTQRWNAKVSNDSTGAGSTETGAATNTMSWDLSGTVNWSIIATAVKPV